MSLTPQEARRVLDGFRDHADFCRQSLTIRNEQGITVPLILTPAQAKLQAAIREQELRNEPVRQIALKARQVRYTVGCCSQIFKRVAFAAGQQALVMADIKKRTASAFNYFMQFVKSYQPYLGLRMLPIKSIKANELIEFEGGSKIDFTSAEDTASGRSFSYRYILFDEFAFFRDAQTLMTGALQSVPDDPHTMLLIVSTANGMGGPFYDRWKMATDPQIKSGWKAVFFPWHEEPKYSRPLEQPMHLFERTYSDEERFIIREHRLTPQQLNWRRWAITNKCGGDPKAFDQEYPRSPEVAFLTSGRPRFDLTLVQRMPVVREPLAGDLHMMRVGTREVPQFVPREDGHGDLRVWKRPTDHKRYVIGADPSKGQDVGEELGTSDPDWSVATVHEEGTGDQVAVLRLRATPAAFAQYVADLAQWYNDAFLVPEANEMGFIEALLQCFPIDRLYTRKRDADDPRPPSTHEVGWMTTGISKPQLIGTLDSALREMSIVIRCEVCVQELRTFIYKPDGKVSGMKGCHDDTVIAIALAVVGLQVLPSVPKKQPEQARQLGPVKYGTRYSTNANPTDPRRR